MPFYIPTGCRILGSNRKNCRQGHESCNIPFPLAASLPPFLVFPCVPCPSKIKGIDILSAMKSHVFHQNTVLKRKGDVKVKIVCSSGWKGNESWAWHNGRS
ncbi:hypothetical protein CEXT_291371 [Caerostris extrusa]|uniref:Uncharacterized protein n=1 Tax=Caerostris extrusa TaxID=172846 RepID=A0AAV4SD27_CAEEX|nr:hypothetical protein CEXT_291371 [Caerostris extrusa]